MAKAKQTKSLVIDPEEFPGNSISSRTAPIRETRVQNEDISEEKPKVVRKRIQGRAIRQKKNLAQVIAEAIVGSGVGGYLWNEVLLPAAKSTFKDAVNSWVDVIIYGETDSRPRSRDRNRSTISYRNFYKSEDDREERRRPNPRDRFGLREIFFEHLTESTDVLEELTDLLDKYEQVTVADYFELAGVSGASWAHNKYGWTDLRRAKCTHTRNGYAIILPEPVELD